MLHNFATVPALSLPTPHGGVAIVFRDLYACKPIKVPASDDPTCKLESVWSLFTWDASRRLIVAALYRPPRRTVAALEADFALLEQQYQHVLIHHPECLVVMAGDLNCDWLATSTSKRFLEEFVKKNTQCFSTLTHLLSRPALHLM